MAQSYMDRGELVPDDVVVEVLREHLLKEAGLGSSRAGGFILDGFPRNIVQAEALADMLAPEGPRRGRQPGRQHGRGAAPHRRPAGLPELRVELQRRRQPARRSPGSATPAAGKLVQRDDDTEEAIRGGSRSTSR